MASYATLVEKTRVPQPFIQRLTVISVFSKLRSAPERLGSESEAGREAIAFCLTSASATVVDQSVRELWRLVSDSVLDLSCGLLELQSALEGCDFKLVPLFVKGLGFLIRIGYEQKDGNWKFNSTENHPFVRVCDPWMRPYSVRSKPKLASLLIHADGRIFTRRLKMARSSSWHRMSNFFRKYRKIPHSSFTTKCNENLKQKYAMEELRSGLVAASGSSENGGVMPTLISCFRLHNCEPTLQAYTFVIKTLAKTSQLENITSVLNHLEISESNCRWWFHIVREREGDRL